jgi:hypothetical protein
MEVFLVRFFEFLSIGGFFFFLFLIKTKFNGNRHYYASLLACGACFLWEWYMDIGPLQLGYDSRFMNLWVFDGIALPLMIPFAYAWYYFLPNLILLQSSKWMDDHWGNKQYLYLYLILLVYNPLVEIPASQLDLWRYFWAHWNIGGIPITNPFMAAGAHLLIYVFTRHFAMKQDENMHFGKLFLHHLAWVSVSFYVRYVPFTYFSGMTMQYWHEKFF